MLALDCQCHTRQGSVRRTRVAQIMRLTHSMGHNTCPGTCARGLAFASLVVSLCPRIGRTAKQRGSAAPGLAAFRSRPRRPGRTSSPRAQAGAWRARESSGGSAWRARLPRPGPGALARRTAGGCLRGRGGGRVELLLPLLYSRVFCFSARLQLACVSLRLQRPPPQASTWTWDRWVSGAGTSVDFSIPGKSRGSRPPLFCITSGAAYGCTPRQLTAGLRPAYRSWASTGARK